MDAPITVTELQEIIRLHNLWWLDKPEGKRADLSGANLRSANLSGANLSGADLRSADLSGADLRSANGFILIGQDVRGYLFRATQDGDGVVVIEAGCNRFIGIAAARAHWENRHLADDVLHEDCLSLIDRCERMAKVRGWSLETESVAAVAT